MGLIEKIKFLCNEKKITIAELERETGISNGQIRRWHTSSPKLENVKKVAEYFNVSLDYLTGFEEAVSELEMQDSFEELAHKFELAGFIIHTEFENHLEYVHIESEIHGTVEKIIIYDFIERGNYILEELKNKYLKNSNDDIQDIAAHHDGDDWTEEELEEIEQFKEFVRMKRKQQE